MANKLPMNSPEWWRSKHQGYAAKQDNRNRPNEFRALSRFCLGPVVEIGPAFGAFAEYLPPSMAYLGVDLASADVAQRMHPERMFATGDIFKLAGALRGTARTVVAMQFIEHFEAPEDALNVCRIIARDRLVFSVPRGLPTPSNRKGDGHLCGWESEDDMRPLLEAYGAVTFIDGMPANHIGGLIDWSTT